MTPCGGDKITRRTPGGLLAGVALTAAQKRRVGLCAGVPIVAWSIDAVVWAGRVVDALVEGGGIEVGTWRGGVGVLAWIGGTAADEVGS